MKIRTLLVDGDVLIGPSDTLQVNGTNGANGTAAAPGERDLCQWSK